MAQTVKIISDSTCDMSKDLLDFHPAPAHPVRGDRVS